ncbi:MAG: M20/M25/M40 family metallo-hydrolase [Ignavibacteria bacterium]|nr:M20/M25/M40 family metallo-hydrolase [Ignavibacteria bacterium]
MCIVVVDATTKLFKVTDITVQNSRLLDIFCEVIKINALSGSERPVADYIKNFLENLNLHPYEDASADRTKSNCGNVLCPIGNGGDFMILSHMDTARPTEKVRPKLLADRITSDGTTVLGVDNRAGIACILYAVEKAIFEKSPLKDFTICFTTQEETTLAGGLNLELHPNIKMGFIFDSHLRPGNFIRESVGSLDFHILVNGKSAHSGLAPEKGIDAIKIAGNAISKLSLGRIDEETTANIGVISGGTAVNVVPELTELKGEIRSLNPEKIQAKADEIQKYFYTAAEELHGNVSITFDWGFKPYTLTPDMPVYKRVFEAILKSGLSPVPNESWGGSDANSLNARGIPSVNLGIGAANPHSNDEYILYEDLHKTSNIIMELITL